jgi:hypothetical protein
MGCHWFCLCYQMHFHSINGNFRNPTWRYLPYIYIIINIYIYIHIQGLFFINDFPKSLLVLVSLLGQLHTCDPQRIEARSRAVCDVTWDFLKMGDPRVTIGFNTKWWPFMTTEWFGSRPHDFRYIHIYIVILYNLFIFLHRFVWKFRWKHLTPLIDRFYPSSSGHLGIYPRS